MSGTEEDIWRVVYLNLETELWKKGPLGLGMQSSRRVRKHAGGTSSYWRVGQYRH